MTRERAQQIGLYLINKEIAEKGLNAVHMKAPMKGKNTWTCKEYKEALENDEDLENADNPIDDILLYEEYLNMKGKSMEDDEEIKNIK